jgi:hypothetical protein
MPTDDNSIRAVEKQFEAEDVSVSPVRKWVLQIVSMAPLKAFDKIAEKNQRVSSCRFKRTNPADAGNMHE